MTLLIAGPGVSQDADLVDGFDRGRIVDIEWALAVGLDGPLEALNPTNAEIDAALKRMAFTREADLEDLIREDLGPERFGGMWLGFDGSVNVAYVGDRPTTIRGDDRHDVVLHERAVTLVELEAQVADAPDGTRRIDIVNGVTYAVPIADAVERDASGVTNQHNVLNRLPGVEMGWECAGGTSGLAAQVSYFVTWQYNSVRQYGWLTVGHAARDNVVDTGCTKTSTEPDGVEKWTDTDGVAYQDADSGSRVQWTGRHYRAVYKQHKADAMVFKMSEANAEKERIHLYGTTVSNSRSAPSDWDMHNNPLKDVHAGTITQNTTLCGVFEDMDGLKCGWYDGIVQDQSFEISWSGSPFPTNGDSGAPVFTADSVANGGPRAVGFFGGIRTILFNDDYYFYRVHDQLNELADKYTVFSGTLEVCSRSADGSWDYNCDPSNG